MTKLRGLNWNGQNLENWIELQPNLEGVICNLAYIFYGNVRFTVIIVVMVIVINIGIEFSFIIIRVWLFGVCFSLYSKLPLCLVQIDFPENI